MKILELKTTLYKLKNPSFYFNSKIEEKKVPHDQSFNEVAEEMKKKKISSD